MAGITPLGRANLAHFYTVAQKAQRHNRSEIRSSNSGTLRSLRTNKVARFFRRISDMIIGNDRLRQSNVSTMNSFISATEEHSMVWGMTQNSLLKHTSRKINDGHPLTLSFMRDVFQSANDHSYAVTNNRRNSFITDAVAIFCIRKSVFSSPELERKIEANQDKIKHAIEEGGKIISRQNMKILNQADMEQLTNRVIWELGDPTLVQEAEATRPVANELKDLFSSIQWNK